MTGKKEETETLDKGRNEVRTKVERHLRVVELQRLVLQSAQELFEAIVEDHKKKGLVCQPKIPAVEKGVRVIDEAPAEAERRVNLETEYAERRNCG